MTINRIVVVAGLTVVLAASVALAGSEQGKGAQQGKGWKKGQGWELFVAGFDANKDGKVSKDELLAKQPGFDRMDADHDGFVTEAEYDAMPAAKNHPNVKGWIGRFDTNNDRKVSLEEWNVQRVKAFDTSDKNKDGFVEKSEFTPELAGGGSANG